jgi:hypothetical protein
MRGFFASMAGAAVCVAAAVAVLMTGLDSWFVADDFVHLGYMRFIDHPWRFFHHPVLGAMIFRPLSFTANFYQGLAFGITPAAIHTADLVNHCINTSLVFILALLVFRNREESADKNAEGDNGRASPLLPALAASLIFAVHPVAAMTATWFACRADLMATAFSLATLAIIAGKKKPGPASLIITSLLSLCAMLCKVTHLPLFLAAFLVALLKGGDRTIKDRLRLAGIWGLPVLNAAVVYYCWRLLVLKGVGGYEGIPASASGIFYQAAYHLPRVWSAASLDFLHHHMDKEHLLFIPLAASGTALLAIGGAGALLREKRRIALGILFIAVTLLPTWNLSHMFSYREERLLYLPLVGFAIIAASLVAGPRRRSLRVACLSAVVFAASFYGLYSRQSIEDWRVGAGENQKLARAMADYIEPQGPTSNARRLYILGLDEQHYYLDMMVKMEMDPAFHDREIITGDKPSFIWITKKMRGELSKPADVPDTALPRRKSHPTDRLMILETATPPDLLEAARHDRGARILEWNGAGLEDITPDLRTLAARRLSFQRRPGRWQTYLPSFSFRKSPLELKWELSPGLAIIEPLFNGEPYTFAPGNNDPYIISPKLSFPALAAPRLDIDMKLPKKPYLAPGQEKGCIMWEGKNHPGYSPHRSICFPVTASGDIEHYSVELHSNVYWARSGVVTGLRLDPVSFRSSFELIRLEFATW